MSEITNEGMLNIENTPEGKCFTGSGNAPRNTKYSIRDHEVGGVEHFNTLLSVQHDGKR